MNNSPQILDNTYDCLVKTINEEFLVNALRLYNEGHHYWTNWACNTGIDTITIDDNLDVFNGACRQDYLGNIHDAYISNTDIKLPKIPTTCRRSACSACSSDLQTTKYKI